MRMYRVDAMHTCSFWEIKFSNHLLSMLIMIYEGCPKIYDLPEEAATVGGELNQLKQKKHNPVLFYTVCTSEC